MKKSKSRKNICSDTKDIPEIKRKNNISSNGDISPLTGMIGVMYAAALYMLIKLFGM